MSVERTLLTEDEALTDLNDDEPDDNSLEALCISTMNSLFQQLEHVLQDLMKG